MIKFWNINYSHHFSPDELMNLFTWLIQNQKQCIFVWFWMQKIIIDKPIPKRQQKYSILSIKSDTNMIIVKRESESYKRIEILESLIPLKNFLKKGRCKGTIVDSDVCKQALKPCLLCWRHTIDTAEAISEFFWLCQNDEMICCCDIKSHFISIYISLDRGNDLTTYMTSAPPAPVVRK